MKVRVVSASPSGEWTTVQLLAKEQRSALFPEPSEAEFSGAVGSLLVDRGAAVWSVGLGAGASVDSSAVRQAAGAASLRLRKAGKRRILLLLEGWSDFVEAAVEGVILGGYRYEAFLPKKTAPIAELVVVVKKEALSSAKKAARVGEILGNAANAAREIGNSPGNLLYPEVLVSEARSLAKKVGLRCRVLDEKDLKTGKFGGVLAVGQGSIRPPRLIIL